MDPLVKDWIDTISKFIGFVGVAIAAGMATWQVRKARIERAEQAKSAKAEQAKELATRQMNLNIARATFWLTLRRMFAAHQEVHVALRPKGEWSKCTPEEAFPKIEAYMGLFEHCQRMLQDQLIDLATFKNIYSYRIESIIRNSAIVRYKLMDRVTGWMDFIQLVMDIGLWPTLEKMERDCLADPDMQSWLSGPYGQEWRDVMTQKFKISVDTLLPVPR